MVKRISKIFMPILLLLVCWCTCFSLSSPVLPTHDSKVINIHLPSYTGHAAIAQSPFNYSSTYRDKVKVRYKGGETPDIDVPASFRITSADFYDAQAQYYRYSFIFCQRRHTSGQRGPPAA